MDLMDVSDPAASEAQVSLHPVDQSNWRAIAKMKVFENQRESYAKPCSYLALCCCGQGWQPLAICLGDQVIGFMMWSTVPADGSCWLRGIPYRSRHAETWVWQAVRAAIEMSRGLYGYQDFALSYQPANLAARSLYHQFDLIETGE